MRVISGSARGMLLKAPNGLATRPTADRVKEALFSIIQFDLANASVLDLFGGTGQLGIEALSRGARSAVFVDIASAACGIIKENLHRTGLSDRAKVFQCDYKNFLERTNDKFDIIFLDPPYSEVFLENALKTITEIDILQSSGIIVTEHPVEKALNVNFIGFLPPKEYKYGKTVLSFYHKE